MINTSKDVVLHKDVPLEDPENEILRFDPVFAKNANFRSILDGTFLKISAQNGL